MGKSLIKIGEEWIESLLFVQMKGKAIALPNTSAEKEKAMRFAKPYLAEAIAKAFAEDNGDIEVTVEKEE